MSVRVPDPTREHVRAALETVGLVAESLGVERSPDLPTFGCAERPWATPAGERPEWEPVPIVTLLTNVEAIGWTVLAHWIEHGGHPIARRMSRIGGASATGWCVTLAGRCWSRAVATPQNHARVAELAAALLVLRRWACPVRPWGLKDLEAEAVDRAQREASVRALGPTRAVALDSSIPASYLAAHGTASE